VSLPCVTSKVQLRVYRVYAPTHLREEHRVQRRCPSTPTRALPLHNAMTRRDHFDTQTTDQ